MLFEFNHLKEFLGLYQYQIIYTEKKMILNTLPFLGVAEENQQDSVIYGGCLEL